MKINLVSLVLLLCLLLAGCGSKMEESLNDESYNAIPPTEITADEELAEPQATQLPAVNLNLEIDKAPLIPLKNTLAAGMDHAMAIADDGSLWAWGSNSHGQVGDGTTENRFGPVKVLDNVSMITAYNNSSMALQYDGTLWAWGDNSRGLLGDGTTGNRTKPIKVMENVIHMSMWDGYTLIVKSDGSLWGLADLTQQGTGLWERHPPFYLKGVTVNEANSPIKLIESGVKYASIGFGCFMIIKEDNTLWGWGNNDEGQVGTGSLCSGGDSIVLEPTFIMENVAYVFSDPVVGRTTIVTTDGILWAWGTDYALRGSRMHSDDPVMLMDNIAVTPNSFEFGIAVTADSKLIVWGSSWYYEEGIGYYPPVESPLLLMENVTGVASGSQFTIVKTINNELWAWGNNDLGQLGISDILIVPANSPVKVMDL